MEKQAFTSHISERLNNSLEDVFNSILEMGGLAENQLNNAIEALVHGDVNRAEEVIVLDKALNMAEFDIERQCANIFARQQPAASDLRLTIVAIRIAIDLERIGDETVKVAKMVKVFIKQGQKSCDDIPGYSQLLDMSYRAVNMLHSTLDAFSKLTVKDALSVIDEEEKIDELFKEAYAEIISGFKSSPEKAECIAQLLLSARAIERVSDHVRNIIENLIYLINGKDIRVMDKKSMISLLNKMERAE